jgi:hypothetical protein
MCGIVGMVGRPLNPEQSYNLITNLLKETRIRGRDATGHFSVNLDGDCEMFKLPVVTDQYVKLNPWQRVSNGTTALIGHARYTTHGSAKNNDNNHPFVTGTGNLAIVHNGVIKDYHKHKSDYKLQTECDSEILLHTIAKQSNVITGIKKVFEIFGEGGDFACEVIYRNPKTGNATFYIFREPGRPAYFIDASKELGQYFFCSDDDIWKDAVQKSGLTNELKDLKPVQVPTYEIWKIDSTTLEIQKTKIEGVNKRTPTVVYSNGHGDWEGYYNHGGFHSSSNHSKYNTLQSTVKQSQTLVPLAEDPHLLEKLGSGWTKAINELGQLVLTYDDELAKKQDEEKSLMDQHVEQVKAALADPSLRWEGWEDEAKKLGVIELTPSNQALHEEAVSAMVGDFSVEGID